MCERLDYGARTTYDARVWGSSYGVQITCGKQLQGVTCVQHLAAGSPSRVGRDCGAYIACKERTVFDAWLLGANCIWDEVVGANCM